LSDVMQFGDFHGMLESLDLRQTRAMLGA
jgi:hypothetical protein